MCGENTCRLYEIPADPVVLATGLRPRSSNSGMFAGLRIAAGHCFGTACPARNGCPGRIGQAADGH